MRQAISAAFGEDALSLLESENGGLSPEQTSEMMAMLSECPADSDSTPAVNENCDSSGEREQDDVELPQRGNFRDDIELLCDRHSECLGQVWSRCQLTTFARSSMTISDRPPSCCWPSKAEAPSTSTASGHAFDNTACQLAVCDDDLCHSGRAAYSCSKNPNVPSAPLPWLSFAAGNAFTSLKGRVLRKKPNAGNLPEASDEPDENLILRMYGVAARVAVKFKWLVVAGAIGLLYLAMQLPVSSEFFPQDRRDQFFVDVILPETSTIEQTNDVVKQLEVAIRKLSLSTDGEGNEIERLRVMRSMVGGGGGPRWALAVSPPSPASNVATILIRTTGGNVTPDFIRDIRRVTNEGDPDLGIMPITGARVVPKALSLGPPAEPVVLRISGDGFANIKQLRRVARKVKSLVQEQEGTRDISDSWGVEGFQISLDIDEEKANLAGVSNSNVADTLNAYYSGLRLSTFREGDHTIPVYFRLAADQRKDLSGIDTAYVEGQNGKLPLNSIAKAIPSWQPVKIERRDMNRTIEVKAEVEDGVSGNDVVNAIMNSEEMKEIEAGLPTGFRIEVGGSLEESQSASTQMLTSFAVSFLAIVLILVIMYNGWSKTLMILATLPMAMTGAWLGLWLTDNPLGFMPQLGLLSLFGIVLNTGIIFIEFADILIKRQAGKGDGSGPISGITKAEFRQCLIDAGKQRMLPIFLTTATTVGGLIPLALSGGPLWEGLAWLMIYGLLVATVLTLFVVPALYAILVETFRIKPGYFFVASRDRS